MNALEAQGEAARVVVALRSAVDRFQPHLAEIHQLDQKLRALKEHLSPDAAQQIDAELDRLSRVVAAAFLANLNPAGEPA